jgi:hypothetical protein
MAKWEQRFREHPSVAALQAVRATLKKIADGTKDADVLEHHARIARVVQWVERALGAADPALISTGLLDRLAEALENLRVELDGYVERKDMVWLTDADEAADALLDCAICIPRAEAPADVGDLQEAITSFRRSAGQLIHNLAGEAAQVEARLTQTRGEVDALLTELDTQKGRIDTAIAGFQEQFSAEEARRRTDFTSTLEEGTRLFREARDEGTGALKELTSAARDNLSQLEKSLARDAGVTLEALREMQASAERVLNAIGGLGMAGGYQRTADTDKKAADNWRLVAALSLAVAIVFNAVLLRFHLLGDRFTWSEYGQKTLVTLPLLLLAGYAGNESRRHRQEERINRAIELQLAALDPYLSLLPEDRANELKIMVGDRFFGRIPGDRPVLEPDTDD